MIVFILEQNFLEAKGKQRASQLFPCPSVANPDPLLSLITLSSFFCNSRNFYFFWCHEQCERRIGTYFQEILQDLQNLQINRKKKITELLYIEDSDSDIYSLLSAIIILKTRGR